MTDFDYQQWRTASAVTPEMLDSCLDRIAKMEAENAQLRADIDYSSIEGAIQREERLRERIAELEAEVERLKVCGNCKHFAAEEFQYCAHPETLDHGYDGDMPYYISAPDKCDFTPTRWEAQP